MKSLAIFFTITMVICACNSKRDVANDAATGATATIAAADTVASEQPTDEGLVLIIFYDAESTTEAELMATLKEQYGASLLYSYKTMNGLSIVVPGNLPKLKTIDEIHKVKGVLSISENRKENLL